MSDPSDAEYEDDRRALDEALDKILDEDEDSEDGDPQEHLAAAEVIRKFYDKYRARLEEDGIDVTAVLRDLGGSMNVHGAAAEAEDKAMEDYLQAKATQAELYARLTEYEFQILRHFDKMSEAEWAAIPPEHQKELRAALDNVRNEMPESLAALPIEKRRQLEGLE
jgi:hypothetical protein